MTECADLKPDVPETAANLAAQPFFIEKQL